MTGLRWLIHELHRRSVWQVLAVYVVGAYVAVEVINNLDDLFGLPQWVAPVALVIFLVGLPIVLATAFVQEGAPDLGERGKPSLPGLETAADSVLSGTGELEPSASSPSRPLSFLVRHLTWRRSLRTGAGAFLLLGVTTVLFMGMRANGIGPWGTLLAKGVLDPSDRVLLADLEAVGEDSAVATAVTEALRVDLERSDIVRLVEPAAVARVLAFMGRDAGARLDAPLAHEIALRDGIAAVLHGSVSRLGDARVITLRLTATSDGAVLGSFRETADDASDVVHAVDRLSAKLRERIGESLRSIRASPALEQVTTSSLDALERYSQAVRIMSREPESTRATMLLEEAVAIDSTFAMAHMALAASYRMTGGTEAAAMNAVRAAYRHRHRLSDLERLAAEAAYAADVRGDWNAVVDGYRAMLDLKPNEPHTLMLLAGGLARRGRFEEAVATARAAIELDSMAAPTYDILIFSLVEVGRTDEAWQAMQDARRLFPADSLWHLAMQATFEYMRDDDAAARATYERIEAGSTSAMWRARAIWGQADLDLLAGRVRESSRRFARAAEISPPTSGTAEIATAAQAAYVGRLFGVDRERAERRLDRALEEAPLPDPAVQSSSWLTLTEVLARTGRVEAARRMLARWREANDPDAPQRNRAALLMIEGHLELVSGHPERALERFRELRAGDVVCFTCTMDDFADAFMALGQADSAAAYWRIFLTKPTLDLSEGSFDRAGALEYLARYHDQRGEDSVAAGYYAEFVELWRNADPELQPRVSAARERLIALTRERG